MTGVLGSSCASLNAGWFPTETTPGAGNLAGGPHTLLALAMATTTANRRSPPTAPPTADPASLATPAPGLFCAARSSGATVPLPDKVGLTAGVPLADTPAVKLPVTLPDGLTAGVPLADTPAVKLPMTLTVTDPAKTPVALLDGLTAGMALTDEELLAA